MKTTAKEYQEKYELQMKLIRQAENEERTNGYSKAVYDLKQEAEKMDKEYFNLLPTVKVSFNIGWRDYYQTVVKIGKKYFKHGQAMTAGRGYRNIVEIPEITAKMHQSMLANSYYY